MVTVMLTQEDALETLRELAKGVERLSGFFEKAPVMPETQSPEIKQARPEAAPAAPAAAVPAPASPAVVEADLELKRRRIEVEELETRAKQAQANLNEANLSQNALEEDQKATRREMESEAAKLSALRSELSKAEELIKAAGQHKATAAQLELRKQEIDAATEKMDQQRRDLESKAADVARWSAASQEANHLKEKLWPDWLRAGSLVVWKEKLEAAISSGNATPAAALLFAALHGYTAATKDSDLKLLHDSLREVSRRLFPWLKENALNDHDAVETAGQWAAEINRECQSRAEVEIPALGAPATNQWMIFRPRPGVNSPDVASVQTWCVRNAQKQPVHRAEVTV